jgi:two-component system cell cycle response regulator
MNSHRGSQLKFLDRLVSLTDERDLGMLERSVLFTACDVLKPDVAVLYRKVADASPILSMVWDGARMLERKDAAKLYNFDLQSSKQNVRVFPIQGAADVIGYLVVERQEPATNEEQMMIGGLLKIYHNFLSVLDESRRDALTGLLNRRMFDQQFQRILTEMVDSIEEVPSSNRGQVSEDDTVWLAMIDIDNFKNINDTFGHLYGDEVLILIARYLTETFREYDLVFRFGGEEFAVLLQTPDKNKAVDVLERLRRGIENHIFPQVGTVTASIGVVQIDEQAIPPLLVGSADEALYYAKGQGKNRVVFFDDIPEEAYPKSRIIGDDIELF